MAIHFSKLKTPALWAGIVAVLVYVLYFLVYSDREPVIQHPRGGVFAGDAQCAQCHQEIHHSFALTAHRNTSAPATLENILGSFDVEKSTFHFNEKDKVVMEKTDSGLYQVGFMGDRKMGAQRFDITVGSGTKGQTFLTWQGTKLFQLPVSYSIMQGHWSSGPGNPTDRFVVNRPIPEGCMNCHSTHASITQHMSRPPDFDKASMIFGITCERCHGPSQEHVKQKQMNSRQTGVGVVNPRHLNRKQKIDLCAQCHSGTKSEQQPFLFLPGDEIVRELSFGARIDTSASTEVHGNQYDLLVASKCYLKSEDLTCNSCHNTHQVERGNSALFSARCQSCHEESGKKQAFCSLKELGADQLKKNCIDCHMPVRASKKIAFRAEGRKERSAEIARSHFISIYPAEAAKIIDLIKSQTDR